MLTRCCATRGLGPFRTTRPSQVDGACQVHRGGSGCSCRSSAPSVGLGDFGGARVRVSEQVEQFTQRSKLELFVAFLIAPSDAVLKGEHLPENHPETSRRLSSQNHALLVSLRTNSLIKTIDFEPVSLHNQLSATIGKATGRFGRVRCEAYSKSVRTVMADMLSYCPENTNSRQVDFVFYSQFGRAVCRWILCTLLVATC
jgi:hypothetical protein